MSFHQYRRRVRCIYRAAGKVWLDAVFARDFFAVIAVNRREDRLERLARRNFEARRQRQGRRGREAG